MAGLLSDVLPWVYSQGDRVKRRIGNLLDSPLGVLEQAAGQMQDSARAQQGALAAAFADPRAPGRVTDYQALNRAIDSVMAGPMGLAPVGMTAWHGSPHSFDAFDAGKIGTGEGAQAYGHGLYLAENPAVANGYATKLSDIDQLIPQGRAARALHEAGGDMLKARQLLYQQFNEAQSAPMQDAALAAVDVLNKGTAKAPNLYKVDIPDSAVGNMLDWDKPLSQQPADAGRALVAMRDAARKSFPTLADDPQAADVYRAYAAHRGGGSDAASDYAASLGVPGIRYLDGGSRADGAGTSNFVVFPGNEGLLQILERNGAAPLR